MMVDFILTLEEVPHKAQQSMQTCESASGRQINSWEKRERVILRVKRKKCVKNVPLKSAEFQTDLWTNCQGMREDRGHRQLLSLL